MRFLLDSNAYGFLVTTPAVQLAAVACCESGRVTFLMTHIQHDELIQIPDEQKRNAIFAIPFEVVETYGMVLGTSKMGLARLGETEQIEAFRSPEGGHTNDALLATTAQYEGAVLVTNEHRLTNFAGRQGIEVWASGRLVDYLTGADDPHR